ncbi:MAG: hypothetical protein P8P30_00205 [Rickettsiales bacterium]|nr:hypothetical protein [Rickettsiales bacterium]
METMRWLSEVGKSLAVPFLCWMTYTVSSLDTQVAVLASQIDYQTKVLEASSSWMAEVETTFKDHEGRILHCEYVINNKRGKL